MTLSKFKLASIIFFISTLFLKFSSMLRDIVIANEFGAGAIVGAYNAAMTIPNTFILFLLTGMKDAFVPSYMKYDQLGRGFEHLTNIVKGTFIIGLFISLLGTSISPVIMKTLFPTFTGEIKEIAIWTSMAYFLSVFLVGINAIYEGYFDSKGKYSFSTFSQTVVVLCTIGSTAFLSSFFGGYSIATGYLIGTIISFLIKLMYFRPKNLIAWKQKVNVNELKDFYIIFIPVGLTIMVGQINLNISNFFAGKFGAEAISYLNYAFRLVSMPQAIFGVTVATLVYPIIARARNKHDINLFRAGIEKGLTIMFLFLAPTVTGMILLMEEIIQLVYQRGAFNLTATKLTTEVAYFYIGSVLFYSIQVIIAKGFYSLEKGNKIMRIGIFSILLNIVFSIIFSQWLGYKGLALSTSVVGFFYTTIAFLLLNKEVKGFALKQITSEYLRILIACIIMFTSLWSLKPQFENLDVLLFVLINGGVGGGIYITSLFILRSSSLKEILLRKS